MSVLPDRILVGDLAPPPVQEGSDPIVAIDRTVGEAAEAVAELHEVFERLRSLVVLADEDHSNEAKIGELFVRAQDYVNQAVADAEERTRQVVADAEFEASRIVMAAEGEARRLLQEARQPTVPSAVTEQLQRTIEGFARVNSDLLMELNSLNRTLKEHASAPPPPPPPPIAASHSSGS